MSDMNLQSVTKAMTADIYQRFKAAVELRRWPTGAALTAQQMEICLQAIIAYEHLHLPLHERTGYVPPKVQACADDGHIHTHEQPLVWKND